MQVSQEGGFGRCYCVGCLQWRHLVRVTLHEHTWLRCRGCVARLRALMRGGDDG